MTLIGCPEKHRQQYLLKGAQGTGVYAAIGVSAHAGIEAALKGASRREALKAVRARWHEFAGLDMQGLGTGDALARAEAYAGVLYDEVLPGVRKGSIEPEWQFYLPFAEDWHFKGAVDHVREERGELVIDDWKTTANLSSWSQAKADKSSQVEAYFWAAWQHWGRMPSKFVFHVVGSKGGVTGYKALETSRPQGLVAGWRDRLVYATEVIGLHRADRPSDKRVDYEWHGTCPWKRHCTPWELGEVGDSVVL